ncbi:YxlC family protein [Paenibacillus harenae]|uniref:YxlC family protein n=1 Tax=Paenibacillus harenae TaxID=306543 RepID=UPI0027D8E85C|nr:YxlC family protein [Paenibacillus harenae]
MMDNPNNGTDDKRWFDNQIGDSLRQFDEAHKPFTPDMFEFEALVGAHKQTIRRKQWKDLLLLWLIGCFLFGGMMWLLERDMVWFVVLQAVIACTAIGCVAVMFGKKKVSRRWNR